VPGSHGREFRIPPRRVRNLNIEMPADRFESV
jgi:hypothetical protein